MCYQEEKSVFHHLGKNYDLNKIFRLTCKKRAQYVHVKEYTWIFEYDQPNIERIRIADTKIPIIICDNVVVDGLHRLAKAHITEMNRICAIVIDKEELEKFEIIA